MHMCCIWQGRPANPKLSLARSLYAIRYQLQLPETRDIVYCLCLLDANLCRVFLFDLKLG